MSTLKLNHPVIKRAPKQFVNYLYEEGIMVHRTEGDYPNEYDWFMSAYDIVAHAATAQGLLTDDLDYADSPFYATSAEQAAYSRWLKHWQEKGIMGDLYEEDSSVRSRISKRWGFKRDRIILLEAGYSGGVCDSVQFSVAGKGYSTDFRDLVMSEAYDFPE